MQLCGNGVRSFLYCSIAQFFDQLLLRISDFNGMSFGESNNSSDIRKRSDLQKEGRPKPFDVNNALTAHTHGYNGGRPPTGESCDALIKC
jgi:hypothetical protein